MSGKIPSSRTFHRALVFTDEMYILGGFDGKRQNDLHVIKLETEEASGRPSSSLSRMYDLDEEEVGMDLHELRK